MKSLYTYTWMHFFEDFETDRGIVENVLFGASRVLRIRRSRPLRPKTFPHEYDRRRKVETSIRATTALHPRN